MQKKERTVWAQWIIGALAVPFFIGGVAVLEKSPDIAYILFVFTFIFIITSLIILVVRKRKRAVRTKKESISETKLPQIDYEAINKVTNEDKKHIQIMVTSMLSVHGHGDLIGLFSDRGKGIPLNELMNQHCSKCGIIRNKRGKGNGDSYNV
jgi:hypothetical protein